MKRWTVEIVVQGVFDFASEPGLHDAEISVTDDITSLRLVTRDSASLYSILNRLQAGGVELLAVHRFDEPLP
jgi:hypothetical protein